MITGLTGLWRSARRHQDLVLGLTRRELFAPFAGSGFGVAWSLFHPLLQMLVYLAVFSWIFAIRFGEESTAVLDYPTYVLSGLVPWTTWATVLAAGCSAVIGSGHLVKQADFPTEVLPLRTVLAALVPHLVCLVVILLWVGLRHGMVLWTWSLLPVVLLLQTVAMLGVAYGLAALCVFVRDVKELVTVFCMLGVFLTPAFYTPEMQLSMPAAARWALIANPFTHFVNVYRDVLFWGRIESPWSWAVVTVIALVAAGTSFRAFERLKVFFGNFV